MDLKKLLSEIGYSDSEVEAISNKKKIYFQDDVDSIILKKENSLKEKYSKTHISKSDYDLLSSEHSNLVKEIKTNKVKDYYLQAGGNEKYFDDYLKLNKGLMDLEDEALVKDIKGSVEKNSWAFNANNKPNIPYQYQDRNVQEPNDSGFDGTSIYGKYK